MNPLLRVRDITVHYGRVAALDAVNLSVAAGEVVAVLGDTGAGKSTLIAVMSGALRPTAGTIEVRGLRVELGSPRDAAARNVQTAYQDLAVIDAQDVAANLALGREPVRRGLLGRLGFLDKPAMRRAVASDLAALGVEVAARQPVELLSGGQRQAIAIARAAARVRAGQEGVLLLDEPSAALGYDQTRRLETLIGQLAGLGIGIVLATHDLPLCFALADRVAVLNRGRKVADVAAASTDQAAVVGWITGVRPTHPSGDPPS